MENQTLISIKDFAALTGVAQSTLRHYDEIGLFTPVSRGENNYRYYAPFQMIILNFINVLSEIGVPLETIKEMKTTRTPERILQLLIRQEINLDRQLSQLYSAYSVIHTFRNNIQEGLSASEGNICVQELSDSYIVLGPENNFEGCTKFYEPFMLFCRSADRYRINLRYPIGGCHHNMKEFLAAPNRPNHFFSLDPHGNTKRKGGKHLIAYHRGYYGDFGGLPDRILSYAKEHQLTFRGPVYISYLLDEISLTAHDQYVSQFMVAVE